MGFRSSKSETTKLADTVAELPQRVADWTPEQRETFTMQSDRAMREQAGVHPEG